MLRFRSELGLAVLAAAALLTGCSSVEAPRDHVTVIVNGERTTIGMEGRVSVEIDGVPEMNYSGPAGCAGGYFADEGIWFRYDARHAYLLLADRLYRFDGPPRQAGDDILWHRTFGQDKITALANCPLPSGA